MRKNLEAEACEMQIARQNYLENLNIQRVEALTKRNAVKYFQLCNEFGVDSENIEDNLLYERGQLESKGELNMPSRGYLRRKISKPVYQKFIQKVGNLRLKPWDFLSDITQKKGLLKEIMGNNVLYTHQGPVDIDKCDDSRVGKAFMNTYKTACRVVGLRY